MRNFIQNHRFLSIAMGLFLAVGILLAVFRGYYLPPSMGKKSLGELAPSGGVLKFVGPGQRHKLYRQDFWLVVGQKAPGGNADFHLEVRLKERGEKEAFLISCESGELLKTNWLDGHGMTGYVTDHGKMKIPEGGEYEIQYAFKDGKGPSGLSLWLLYSEGM